jgi:CRP-like cAMP-binding protein
VIQPLVKVALQRSDVGELLKGDPELFAAPMVKALLMVPEALKTAVLRRFQPAAVLWSQGDEGQSLMLVLKGSVQLLSRRDTESAELAVVNKGDVLGESEVLSGRTRRGASVLSMNTVEVLELPRETLLSFGALPKPLAKELERVQAGRARALDDMSDFLNRW